MSNESANCETKVALDSPAASDKTSLKNLWNQKTTPFASLPRNESLKIVLAKKLGMNSCHNLSIRCSEAKWPKNC